MGLVEYRFFLELGLSLIFLIAAGVVSWKVVYYFKTGRHIGDNLNSHHNKPFIVYSVGAMILSATIISLTGLKEGEVAVLVNKDNSDCSLTLIGNFKSKTFYTHETHELKNCFLIEEKKKLAKSDFIIKQNGGLQWDRFNGF